MNRIKYLYITILVFANSYSQSIEGTIVDKDNEYISICNITVFSKDSIFVKGTTTDNKGYYKFNNLEKDVYTLNVTKTGFVNYHKSINMINNNVVHNIVLNKKTENLAEVVIKYKKPIITHKKGKLIYNIDNSILSTQNSWNILSQTPSVLVNNDVIIVNNVAATIYINDKKIQLKGVQLKSYLESLDGNIIKQIEVLDNPSAKYEANNNSIINIILIKNKLGYKGSFNTNYTQGINTKYSFGTSQFYTTKKLNIFVNYNFSPQKYNITMDESIIYFDENNIKKSKWNSFYDLNYKQNAHSVIFNTDYRINKKSKLVLSTLNFFQPKKITDTDTNGGVFDFDNNLTQKYMAKSIANNNNKNLSYALDYKRDLKLKGENISIGVIYNYYNNTDNQNTNTDYYTANNVFETSNKFKVNSKQNVKIYSATLDYSTPLKNKVKFELGTKVSNINLISSNSQYNFITNDYIIDLNNSDKFKYNELNIAAYSTIAKSWDKWYAKFGLRGEQTNLEGVSGSMSQINSDNYLKLFPSAYLSYFPSKKHDFSVSYSKRIEKAKYKQLNPFHSYYSDFAVTIGNPNLKPAIKNSVDFKYLLNSKHSFGLFYSIQTNGASEFSYQDNDNEVINFMAINMVKKINAGFKYFSNISITKRWSLTTNTGMYYIEHQFNSFDDEDIIELKNIWRKYLVINNNFTFLKDKSLRSSLYFYYSSPYITESYTQSERNFITFNVSKKIMKKKATISLTVRDIFNTDDAYYLSKYGNQNNGYLQKNESRFVKVGFIYNFGNRKLKENKSTKKSSENDRLNE